MRCQGSASWQLVIIYTYTYIHLSSWPGGNFRMMELRAVTPSGIRLAWEVGTSMSIDDFPIALFTAVLRKLTAGFLSLFVAHLEDAHAYSCANK